ncbi:MAG: IS1634 family transposase [Acidimicrobiales bacterium]
MRPHIHYGPPEQGKSLGALPVVAHICRSLDVAGIVDRACPVRDVARLSHGAVIEALIANRLSSPAPLVRVADWAAEWAVEEIFGIDPGALNDDRLGRALDAVAPKLEGVIGSIGAGAIAAFGIDVARLHWDMTSISVFGDYEHPESGFIEPRYGHPKDRRPDLKQVQTGLAVSADGGIPIFHRAYSGGAAEVSQVVGAMVALRKIAAERRFLMVGDSKLVSYSNLGAMIDAGVTFVAPASKRHVSAATLGAQDREKALVVDYVAERDSNKAPEERGTWAVRDDSWALAGPKRSDPVLSLRRVFVYSSARATAAKVARDKKLARATDDLTRLTNGLGGRHYPDAAAVRTRVDAIATKRRVKDYLVVSIGVDEANKPTFTWSYDQVALDAEAASDGWYALLTNLDPAEAGPAEVLLRYKGQEVVERRYGDFKGPLAVAPMFLKNNARIQALISVICLALLIFSLVERGLRAAIAPLVLLDGLWAGRPAKPTGRLIFGALANLRLIPATDTSPAIVPQPPPLQAKILALLHVDPTQPR